MKKLKSILSLLFAFLFILVALSGCTLLPPEQCSHIDEDSDSICDVCGEGIKAPPCNHKDDDKNYLCDSCEEYITPTDTDGKIALIKNSTPLFNIVIGDDVDNETTKIVEQIINTLNPKLNAKIRKISQKSVQDIELECEIIIGSDVNRDDKYILDGHDYGEKGYAIKIIDKKIIVVAGSSASLFNAVELLKNKLFAITSAEKIGALFIDESFECEKKQDNYSIKSVTIADKPLADFTITAMKWHPTIDEFTSELQERLYLDLGVWLDVVDSELFEGDSPEIKIVLKENTGKGDGFYVRCTEEGDLLIECEFIGSIGKGITSFINEKIFYSGSSNPKIEIGDSYSLNVRDVYYKDFGAVGDGVTDDFMAIKSAHDFANEDGYVVHADPDATYYFGNGSGKNTIYIKSDTYWYGCKFIFDDSDIEPGSGEYATSIFTIASSHKTTGFSGSGMPFTSLKEGDTRVDYAPGYRAMLILTNQSVKHFIRYGPNQDSGAYQTELIMIDKDGNIDPSTPVQWTYDEITSIVVINVEDKPITIDGGGQNGRRTVVETIFNGAPSQYTYYKRNIFINRSNATIKNIRHIITGQIPESQGGTGAPYHGFTEVSRCEKSNIDNFIFQMPQNYNTIGSAGTSVGMGTYEMSATYSNEILWSNCTQSNFFEPDGSVKYHGLMGTNYCKNLTFDNMFVCSFDAHKGTYNATLKNSTCEHINFIGEGTITLENMTIYTDGANSAIVLRDDYGSTWQGDLVIDGLDLRYSTARKRSTISLIKAVWYDHDFGYQTYLPENISLTNVKLSRYDYGISDGVRWETTAGVNEKQLYVLPTALTNNKNDITKLVENGGYAKKNPYIGIKKIEMFNCGDLELYISSAPIFSETELWIDNEKQ